MGKQRSPGFTLVELMIVISIVGLLAAIAYPLIIGRLRTARSAEAPLMVENITKAELQFFLKNPKMSTDPSYPQGPGDFFCFLAAQGFYNGAYPPPAGEHVFNDGRGDFASLGVSVSTKVRYYYLVTNPVNYSAKHEAGHHGLCERTLGYAPGAAPVVSRRDDAVANDKNQARVIAVGKDKSLDCTWVFSRNLGTAEQVGQPIAGETGFTEDCEGTYYQGGSESPY